MKNHTKLVKEFYKEHTIAAHKWIPWGLLSSEAKLFWIDLYNGDKG